MAKKFTMSLSKEMHMAIEREKTARKLGSIQETIRSILADYFKKEQDKI